MTRSTLTELSGPEQQPYMLTYVACFGRVLFSLLYDTALKLEGRITKAETTAAQNRN